MAQDHAAHDLAPMLLDVQAALAERKAIKAEVPWSEGRKTAYRAIQALDGLANVAIGAAAVAGDFVSMGMASQIIAPVVLAKDAAVASAGEHLSGGVSGEGAAKGTASNIGVAQAKSMVGPISAHGVNMVPIAGGAVMAGKGIAQIAGAVTGALPEGAAGDQAVFADIRSCRDSVTGVLATLQSKQAVLNDPGLASVIAQLGDFIDWLNRQEEKARERFVKSAEGPATRGRAGGGESQAMMSAQHNSVMTAAALRQRAGEASSWARFKSKVGAGESTYQKILALVQKHEALAARPAAEAAAERMENAQLIYATCVEWLEGHDEERDSAKYAAIADVMKQARDDKRAVERV
jgi:hypothetical protein